MLESRPGYPNWVASVVFRGRKCLTLECSRFVIVSKVAKKVAVKKNNRVPTPPRQTEAPPPRQLSSYPLLTAILPSPLPGPTWCSYAVNSSTMSTLDFKGDFRGWALKWILKCFNNLINIGL